MPPVHRRRAVVPLVCVAMLLPGCRDEGPPPAAPLPDATVVAAPSTTATPLVGAWPSSQVVGGPRGSSSITRLQVPGAPSYTAADDRQLVPWAASFAAQVAALPVATPPPAGFRAVSAPAVTAAVGDWTQITTEAEITDGTGTTTATSWTLYADVAENRTLTSGQLLTEAGRTWVQDQAHRLVPDDSPAAGPDGDLSDVRLQPDGSALVMMVGTGPARALAVPPAALGQLLTPQGQDAARQLSSGAQPIVPPARPGAAPAPLALPSAPPAPDCTQASCIALTFDDGPGPYTDQLLDELAAAQAPATFFLVGKRVAARASTVARMADAGHSIGNHSWDHADLTTLTAGQLTRELDQTDQAIAQVTGRTPTLVRPPYGAVDSTVLQATGARGDVAIGWDIDTLDWQNRDLAATTQRAIGLARRGGIVLMHDIHPTTVQAVPGIVAGLRAAGYTLVTIDQLIGATAATGVLVSHGP